jgi:uncharacterized protein YaaN involved in tellurite resistance
VSDLETDVALIKKDIKTIERFFNKFDSALATMSDISQKVAVQGEILKNTADKLEDLEERITEHKREDVVRGELIGIRLEEYRTSSRADHEKLAADSRQNRKERNEEIMAELHKMNGNLDKRLTSLDNRIRILEQGKWYIMGLGAVIVFLASQINWNGFFG